MNVKFNSEVLKNLLKKEYDEEKLTQLLNEIMDKEVEKEEPDFDLIDECTQALIVLNGGKDVKAMPAVPADEIIAAASEKRIKLSKNLIRVLIIAAVLVVTTITASAAYTNATGNRLFESFLNSGEQVTEDVSLINGETMQKASTKPTKSSDSSSKSNKKKDTTKAETTEIPPEVSGAIGERITEENEEDDITSEDVPDGSESDAADGEEDEPEEPDVEELE